MKTLLRPCLMRFENEFLLAFLLVVLLTRVTSQEQQSTYPEGVHQLVVERLNKIRGESSSRKFGSWGEWSQWSPCSRSCGTGVSTQSRECRTTQHRKKRITRLSAIKEKSLCVGRYKRFQLCNPQGCPGGYKDFRKEQCESFNKTPYDKKFYTWEPYIDVTDSCSLNCRALGLSFYATLNQSVIDGTPCGAFHPENRVHNRVCVGGKCTHVGCDGVLGSGRVVDACGQCGGDNSTCRIISGVYSRSRLPFGYNLIATLPPKAENVSIYHVSPSSNYLALRELGGNYLLNGPWGVNSSGSSPAAGTVFHYVRPQPFQGDYLFASGPLTHSIDVMLFYQNTNPGIKYEYRLPLQTTLGRTSQGRRNKDSYNPHGRYSFAAQRSPVAAATHSGPVNDESINSARNFGTPGTDVASRHKNRKRHKKNNSPQSENGKRKSRKRKYIWTPKGFTDCTPTCGEGFKSTRYICVKKKSKAKEVPTQFCSQAAVPMYEKVSCNLTPCPPQWQPEDWGSCSVTCGLGVQLRNLSCKEMLSSDKYLDLSEEECEEVSPIPRAQVCQKSECSGPPKWQSGPWSTCSKFCGIGTRTRKVHCVTSHGILSASCPYPKPSAEQMCDTGSCASDTWFFSSWDKNCNGPCGEGVQKRRVHCSGDALGNSSDSLCSRRTRPSETRSCEITPDCEGSWFAGPWNECDVQCGSGQQRRAVVCIFWSRNKYKVTDDSKCKASGRRPSDSQPCTIECRSQWFTSDWSQCSVSCGDGGVQRREVKCLGEDMTASLACPSATKPDSRQLCNTQSCDKSNTYRYLGKSHTSYVSKANIERSRTNRYSHDHTDGDDTRVEGADGGSLTNLTRKPKSGRIAKGFHPISPGPPWNSDLCIDRMKNCHLVYKARLCKLKYYNKLCCETCKEHES